MKKQLVFSLTKLKGQCKTKSQRVAFNRLMSSFATKVTVAEYFPLAQALGLGKITALEAKNAKNVFGSSNLIIFDSGNVFVPKIIANIKQDDARVAKYLVDLVKSNKAILSSKGLIILPKDVFTELFKKGTIKEAIEEDSAIEE